MASVPGAAVATMARAAGPPAPAGDGGVPARDPLQPLLRPGESRKHTFAKFRGSQRRLLLGPSPG